MHHKSKLPSIRQAFADTIVSLAKIHPDLFVVSADLKSSLLLGPFARRFPSRFVECGVAESNAAGIAAGLAKSGKTVFLATYACFSPAINWAVIKQSICYNSLPVKIVGSHAGLLTGELAATHQMLEDLALMRTLPDMEVFSPADSNETVKITRAIFRSKSPSYLRLVRPTTPAITDPRQPFTIGKASILCHGRDLTIIGHGPILSQCLDVVTMLKGSISIEVINSSSIKPLDSSTIIRSVRRTNKLIVVEDHQKIGGLGEAISYLLLTRGLTPRFIHLAIDDSFGRSARDWRQLYNHYGLGTNTILQAVYKLTSQ